MSDPIFPALHIRPAHGWLNDPNGLSRIDGRWHVFFQYNPTAPVHDAICWGHVSSPDLLAWQEHPVALRLRPDGLDRAGCWSGCVVDDHGVPTAVYTAVRDQARDAVVALATSDRSMIDWSQRSTPVVGTPVHPSVTEARDPFLFTFDGHRYAIQGCGRPEGGGTPLIMAYGCDDLEHWDELGPMITAADPVAGAVAAADIWECPGLVPLGDRWLLVLSLWRAVDGGGELSGVRWLVGDLGLDDGRLRFNAEHGGVLDDGPSFYAPQLLLDGERVLLWSWAWELDRTQEQIDRAGWAGVLTFPRELSLDAGSLVSRPAAELIGLRREDLGRQQQVTETAFEVLADGPISLSLRTGDQVRPVITADALGDGPSRILVDASLVEGFGEHRTFTTRAYPGADSVWVLGEPAQIYRLGRP